MVQSSGAVKYTNCISTEGLHSLNECAGYEIKASNNPVMLDL